MPAQNLKQLLDFETQFETALAGIVEDELDISASIIHLTLDQDDMETPRVEISIEINEALDQPTAHSDPAVLDYSRYAATLNMAVITDATIAGTASTHRHYRAKLRGAMLQSRVGFNSTNLPYYEVVYLRPLQTAFSVDGMHAVSEMSWQMHFVIKPDAWPVPPEPEPEE